MNISKDQIVQFLESQGNHDQAQQAGQQLPDQVYWVEGTGGPSYEEAFGLA